MPKGKNVSRKAVIITGLYRTTQSDGYWCDQFSSLLSKGCRVVVSTWAEEVEKYAAAFQRMSEAGVEVIAAKAPVISGNGNAAYQQIAMKNALLHLDPDDYVLKTRFDFWNESTVSWFVADEQMPLVSPGAYFSHKIIVPSAFLWQFFYINDIFFVGTVSDIRKLLLLPLHLGCYYPNLAPEQFLYWPCFEYADPVVTSCMRSNVGLVFDSEEAGLKIVEEKLEFRAFRAAIASYFVMLRQHFAFFADEMNGAPAYVDQECKLGDLISGARALGTNRHATVGEAIIESGRFFDALAQVRVDSPAIAHLQECYETYSQGGNVQVEPSDIEEFQAWAAAKTSSLGKQDARPGQMRDGIFHLGNDTGWRLAGASDESVALQNEVSRLRRLLERQSNDSV
jgi:hypothetical protein